jgi:outer membrane murein-binding lipoprotein Lpp
MFVPIDYEDPFEKEAEELRSQVETLTAKVAKMSKTPKAKPAHEEVKTDPQTYRKTGNKGLDKIAALMKK